MFAPWLSKDGCTLPPAAAGWIDISALAIFAGVVGVGLGFGLQDIARNFVSGISILIERPIQSVIASKGDRVESALSHSRWRRCRALLVEVAREYLQVLADPAPVVCFSGFGESSLDIELGVWSEEMSYRPRHFRSDLNFAIERKLREAGIEIPFPQRDVHIRTAPADPVRGENPPPETPRAPR